MPSAETYEKIATYLVPSATNSYTFSNIPSTYDDLIIVGANLSANLQQTMYAYYNGDTGSNYNRAWQAAPNSYGSYQTSAVVNNNSGGILVGPTNVGLSSSQSAGFIMEINQYANTSYPKVSICKFFQAQQISEMNTSMWTGTNAITSIQFYLTSSATIAANTRITIYGVKKA